MLLESDAIFPAIKRCVKRFPKKLKTTSTELFSKEIMEEAHSSAYAMHPGSTKMYHTLREYYWWRGMKKDVAEFVSRCLICQ